MPRKSVQQCIASCGHSYGSGVARHESQPAVLSILQKAVYQAVLNNLQRRSGLRTISCSTRAHSLFLAAAMAPASATLKNSAAQPAPAAASATQPAPQRRSPVSHDDPRWCVGPLPSLEVVHVHSCQNKAKDLRSYTPATRQAHELEVLPKGILAVESCFLFFYFFHLR